MLLPVQGTAVLGVGWYPWWYSYLVLVRLPGSYSAVPQLNPTTGHETRRFWAVPPEIR